MRHVIVLSLTVQSWDGSFPPLSLWSGNGTDFPAVCSFQWIFPSSLKTPPWPLSTVWLVTILDPASVRELLSFLYWLFPGQPFVFPNLDWLFWVPTWQGCSYLHLCIASWRFRAGLSGWSVLTASWRASFSSTSFPFVIYRIEIEASRVIFV